ncbi:MAG: hypothetical protein KF686_11245 [Ramlibacter sp.]|nr:hypothetical protein [Ramlibacter sp.]
MSPRHLPQALLAVVLGLLGACGNQPPVPDWQMDAQGALARFTTAYLGGNARVEAAEMARARSAIASTGKPVLMARAELTRCAARVASLVLAPCEAFEPLRPDVPAAERAYADYLAGRLAPADVALLPPAQRAVAAGATRGGALQAIADPLSRLVAAGVLFRTGQANPEVMAVATQTASDQGWRRPLLAWLGVQLERAQAAGASDEVARLRRRIALVTQEP